MFKPEWKILFEDEALMVIYKPAGLAVQSRSVATPDLESELTKYLGKVPFIVHRLDQPVEGLMVVAKHAGAAGKLSRQAGEGGTMKKVYRAEIFGHMSSEEGELKDFLQKDGRSNTSRVVKDPKEGKAARLSYRVLESREKSQMVEIHLYTGRHHQIRVQFSHAGYPLLGDRKYGNEKSKAYSEQEKIDHIRLQAYALSFVHPVTGNNCTFSMESISSQW